MESPGIYGASEHTPTDLFACHVVHKVTHVGDVLPRVRVVPTVGGSDAAVHIAVPSPVTFDLRMGHSSITITFPAMP